MRNKIVIAAAYLFLALTFITSRSENISGSETNLIYNSDRSLTIQWSIKNLNFIDMGRFTSISYDNAIFDGKPGEPKLPYREFILGMPDGADFNISLSVKKTAAYNDMVVIPVGSPERNQNDIVSFRYEIDTLKYNSTSSKNYEIEIGEYFREMPLLRVRLHPLKYNHKTREVRVITDADIFISFSNFTETFGTKARSAIDGLYKNMILNYDQAQKWHKKSDFVLKKQTAIPDGPWYGTEVEEEGIYKITYSTLQDNGIDVNSIDPRTFKIYNTGGYPLNFKALADDFNPEYNTESPIYVSGDQDGSFDSNDYILFYGKPAGGWYYKELDDAFRYKRHNYDTKNIYWLTFGQTNGKRMSVIPETTNPAAQQENYFTDRIRYEKDEYNLLASGPDWYGERFYGTSGNLSLDFDLDVFEGSGAQAKMLIRLKGGSGIKWEDITGYRYSFAVYVNPDMNPVPLFQERTFSNGSHDEREKDFVVSEYLKNGTNRVTIDYTGNRESCSAYLDWIEFYYPRDFVVKNDQLIFYTQNTGNTFEYELIGFQNSDVILFDVSDPLDVKIVADGAQMSGDRFNFKLDLTDNSRRKLIASSLSSSEINNVNKLLSYNPHKNLLDTANKADFVIITHPSFRDLAQEIVDLRASEFDPLQGIVASTDDIYFYFSSGIKDPVAIRNFLRYAYNYWSEPKIAFVTLFGDGHYDYRNITISDTNRVPPFEIYAATELDSRESDNFYVDIDFNNNTFNTITPDLAVGRIPVNTRQEAQIYTDKLLNYYNEMVRDGWQTILTFVADDAASGGGVTQEWIHQFQTEELSKMSALSKFLKKKIYLSAFESEPGGFGRVKPAANRAILDQLNEGTLIINYVGHGSPTQWAHENVLEMNRDLNRIKNEGKLPFWIAATCDFGKFDDPNDKSFTEELLVVEKIGAIGVLSSSRLVFSSENYDLNKDFLKNLFTNGQPSRRLGSAMLMSNLINRNDQKYHLFSDPTLYLADPRNTINIDSVEQQPLKALSTVKIEGTVENGGQVWQSFQGAASMLVNDARFDSVNTGGNIYYTVDGPRIFKGEISVNNGIFEGEFIVPKSIRYVNDKTGRITIYAWNESGFGDAFGYVDTLLFYGTEEGLDDDSGPAIEVTFESQDFFSDGDFVGENPVLKAKISDESGINLTQEVGHTIDLKLNNEDPKNITGFFAYNRDSFTDGELEYVLTDVGEGEHILEIKAWDNLNNPSSEEIRFNVLSGSQLRMINVVNFPNPFSYDTHFTFQAFNASGAQVVIKVYTISGRQIYSNDMEIVLSDGFNKIYWDGRDNDGDRIANGVYLYKIILKKDDETVEKLDKLVVLR